MFIPGFLDTAVLRDGVFARLSAPLWWARAVNLRHVDDADPSRRGAILEGYRNQVLDGLDHIDPTAQRPVVVGDEPRLTLSGRRILEVYWLGSSRPLAATEVVMMSCSTRSLNRSVSTAGGSTRWVQKSLNRVTP